MRTGLSVTEARETILAATSRLSPETVTVREGLGRVLARSVHSTRTLPPADCSAMDGYALRIADVARASVESPVELRVAFEVAAGGLAERELEPGEVARIFTGAAVPRGADTVVRQEDTERDGDRVRVLVAPEPHEHVRSAGEDLEEGDLVLETGTVLRAAEIGVLASLGRTLVSVYQRPRVAILSGGDELVEPDGDVAGGRIVSSNSYTLAAQCLEAGAEPVNLGIARDDPEDIERLLRAGLGADCLVSSAGVSVGDRDYVRPVLARLGCRLDFWGVDMKPGFPLAFGSFGGHRGPLVFGLPGNPVSASVTFELFVRPALRKMAGFTKCFRPTVRARLAHGLSKRPGRVHFVRVRLEKKGDEILASSTGNQSSGVLTSLTRAQGLLVFAREESELAEGALAPVVVVDEAFYSDSTPGY